MAAAMWRPGSLGNEFNRSAIPGATVEFRGGRFSIAFSCPVLLNPGSRDERVLGKRGQTVRFVESAGRFQRVTRKQGAR
jgi:hypothetical protein